MLLNDFYKLDKTAIQIVESKIQINAELTLNESHIIFDGHFPGTPILPGVCMVQIIKEIIEDQLAKKFKIASAGSIKFLAVFNPEIETKILANISIETKEIDSMEVESKLYYQNVTYFKMKAVLVAHSVNKSY